LKPSTPRRRLSLGPSLVFALVIAALAPALTASWLLSVNSSKAIETLAENAMSQAAHRVDVGALAHLGESHTVVNALVPPFNATGTEGERTRKWIKDTASFETMAYALTQQSVNVPYIYIGSADGSFFGLEKEEQGFVVRQIRPGDTGRTHHLIIQPGDRSQLLKTEATVYDPRKRPWYQLAASTGKRVFTDVYRSAVKNQFDLTLAQPIYDASGKTLLGVLAVDMSLARLTELIRSTKVSDNAVTYLVDGQGRMVASSTNEELSVLVNDKYQRITPMQSGEPLVRDSFSQLSAQYTAQAKHTGGMLRLRSQESWWQRIGLEESHRLMALQRPFGGKYQLDWQLIVVAPESDFTSTVDKARRLASLMIASLIALSALIAFGVARGLSRQFRQLNESALALGAGQLPEVQESAPFREVHTLSQVMHDSAMKLQRSSTEIAHKNQALQDAAQLLEERVTLRTSELATSREEALAAVKAKAGFLAVMSHEIRTPLHGVVGMSELLKESSLDATQQELLEVLKLSSDQLLAVVDDILDFSKIEAGHLRLEQKPLDIRATIGEAADIIRVKAKEKNLPLTLQVAPDVPQAMIGDEVRLRQVLLNLLSNAIKFTEHGEVTLRVWFDGDHQPHQLWFSVTDTGSGISQAHLPELFQPFAQGDTSTARVHGGTGLGLMICKHIVEQMEGQISVESAPWAGSTFRFSVRYMPAALADVTPTHTAVLPREPRAQRILVVDDNPVNLKVASAMLARLGYPHDSAANGALAMEAIAQAASEGKRYSVVLLDSHMPVMDGRATAIAIRNQLHDASPVLIGVSASTLGEDQQRCLDAGMSDYLPKPLELERLATALKHWCAQTPTAIAPSALTTSGPPAPDAHWISTERWSELDECDDATSTLRREMVNDFLGSLSGHCDAIETAAKQGGGTTLFEHSHALKGSAENLGAYRLGEVCSALEQAAKAGESKADEKITELHAAAESTRKALQTYLAAFN
jgi:signal transduction histidine kinase/CheY-like chemotaxis protein/HPt (histidine-containing phosphotransfer) domain-containing protein